MKMEEDFYVTCDKCKNYGVEFRSKHNVFPIDLIDGNIKAEIWIIGLNPKNKVGHIEVRNLNDFKLFNPSLHSYFRDFRKVSEILNKNWESQDSNVAHNDLVKCFFEAFPSINSENEKNNQRHIVDNCVEFLKEQIIANKPKMIICNGSPVCSEMIRIFPPQQTNDLDTLTSYCANIDNHNFWIVLSGFIGSIDNRNKRRLGMEIEQIIEIENIKI